MLWGFHLQIDHPARRSHSWRPMFELLHDWQAWSGAERAAVAALALCFAVVLVAWVGV